MMMVMVATRNERGEVVHLCLVLAARELSLSLDISQHHYPDHDGDDDR